MRVESRVQGEGHPPHGATQRPNGCVRGCSGLTARGPAEATPGRPGRLRPPACSSLAISPRLWEPRGVSCDCQLPAPPAVGPEADGSRDAPVGGPQRSTFCSPAPGSSGPCWLREYSHPSDDCTALRVWSGGPSSSKDSFSGSARPTYFDNNPKGCLASSPSSAHKLTKHKVP